MMLIMLDTPLAEKLLRNEKQREGARKRVLMFLRNIKNLNMLETSHVESISKFESFNLWDDSTCLPIRRSEFRPLIKLSNNMPSACLSIWLGLPGNIITGLLVLFLIRRIQLFIFPSSSKWLRTRCFSFRNKAKWRCISIKINSTIE